MRTLNFKTLPCLIFALILFTLDACGQKQDFEKIPSEKVEKEATNVADGFINNFYSALKNGGTFEFSDANATTEVRSTFTPEMQRTTFEQIKTQLGEYESAEFAEAWVQSSNPSYKIFRFKGKFSKSTAKVEIRVVLNEDNKIAGFFVKPWSDSLG